MRRRAWGFGFGPGDWFWGTGARRGGRRGQWFEAGDMKYVILKLLRDKPMHGYEVMKALEEETHGCYKPSPGTVYPTLQWLEDEGLVSAETADGKKVYSITDQGRQFLLGNVQSGLDRRDYLRTGLAEGGAVHTAQREEASDVARASPGDLHHQVIAEDSPWRQVSCAGPIVTPPPQLSQHRKDAPIHLRHSGGLPPAFLLAGLTHPVQQSLEFAT